MKIGIYTLGCKVNQYETQAMEQELTARGHELVDFESPADAYIINTCSVTAVSDKKSRQMIRRAKKNSPDAVVAACGCYVQTHEEEAKSLGIDLLMGTNDRARFLDRLEEAVKTRETVADIDDALRRRTFEVLPAGGMANRTRAMLKVEDGCVNFCTYCIIPYARGPVRSLPMDKAAEQVRALREQGYCPSTINSAVSAANSLLAFCGRRGWQVMPAPLPETEQPELTREEYLRLLQTARILEKERAYLLVKLLGTTGLPVHLLDAVTVSAAQAGGLPEYDMQLCICLKEELLDFAGREGILSGPIFITRRGTPVGRTTVTALIQSLAHDAQVEAGKCTPRCLRKLYLQTQERILHNISTLAREEYEKLLLSEQEKTGWNA